MKNFSLHILYLQHILSWSSPHIDLMKYFIFILETSYFKDFFRLKLIGKNHKDVPPQLQHKTKKKLIIKK